ncbi:MAG: hypothetical protein JST12_15935 [Armatimonadetes bacterium]|nr:hypothetical protein [Armatimonadota bacterium]
MNTTVRRLIFPIIGCAMIAASHAQLISNPRDEHVGGYVIVPHVGKIEADFNAGYSMYVTVWPLLSQYPGHRFQSGLPGTWMFAQYEGSAPKDMYSDIEGGLGWWTDTRFPTTTPKFIMGGVAPNFSEIANGPSHGWGDWSNPRGLYGVAQLSQNLLFPIDGLDIKQGEIGRLFGYGYLNLPLCEEKSTTDGINLPTGANSWTLFINSANFKGPVAFFLPHFWSHATVKDTRLVGQLLDTRPANPNRAVQMETQNTPCRLGRDDRGNWYARIAPISFPADKDGTSVMVHNDTVYNQSALFDDVLAWFKGGHLSTGKVDPAGAQVRNFGDKGYATWQIWWKESDGKERKVSLDWSQIGEFRNWDRDTFGGQFVGRLNRIESGLVTLPEYYRLVQASDEKKSKWIPISPSDVPEETGLRKIRWERTKEGPPKPYSTPDEADSTWKKPGPAAGPFKVRLGDGSVVTYYWYRFADQPALLNSDLTKAEREALQVKVEMIHRAWKSNRDYLPPPTRGTLASLDPAQLVKPPKGLEIGYVPIATRQELDQK